MGSFLEASATSILTLLTGLWVVHFSINSRWGLYEDWQWDAFSHSQLRISTCILLVFKDIVSINLLYTTERYVYTHCKNIDPGSRSPVFETKLHRIRTDAECNYASLPVSHFPLRLMLWRRGYLFFRMRYSVSPLVSATPVLILSERFSRPPQRSNTLTFRPFTVIPEH